MRTRRDAVLAVSRVALALAAHVLGAQQPAAPAAAPAALPGAVYGVVYDSLARRPLVGAYVQVVQIAREGDLHGGRSVMADAAGAFRVDSLAPGRYLVGLDHPLLDLLRVEIRPRLIELGPGGYTVRLDLGVPDLATLRPVLCGSEQAPTDSSGLLAGRVRDAADDAPVASATVVLTWSELSFGAGGVRTERRRVPVTTGPGGHYVVCGVPTGVELTASVAAPGRAGGPVELEVPVRGFLIRDLTLGDTTAGATAAAPARGTARLTGTVRDTAGRPVRGARATVWGTAAAATAGEDGAFTLGGLPAGTRTLEVRAIGFAVRQVAVDLSAARAARADVRLQRVTALNPVTVFGTPSPPSPFMRDFLERQRDNPFGRFLTRADFQQRRPVLITDALRAMPGLQIDTDERHGNVILGRSKKGGSCPAVVVVNGLTLPQGERLDPWASPDGVVGVEVYVDATHAPPQYGVQGRTDCSVVLVWTGP